MANPKIQKPIKKGNNMRNMFTYDFTNRTIVATKATLKKASNPTTDEYTALIKISDKLGEDFFIRRGQKIELDLNEYQSAVFNMFVKPEKEYTVKLRCVNKIADAIIDRFGKDVMLIPADKTHFTVSVRIQATTPFFGWVCSFGKQMKILYPPEVVQEMDKFLRELAEMYQDKGKM